jgi:hypothetical protein
VREFFKFAGFVVRHARCIWSRMAKRFDELDAWQLANDLKLKIYALTESGSIRRKKRNQPNDG